MNDVSLEIGANFNSSRFVPFVVMHEFESLLFSDCTAFARAVGLPNIEAALQTIRDGFSTPVADDHTEGDRPAVWVAHSDYPLKYK